MRFIEFPRMQMTYVWQTSYKKNRKFTDDAELVTITPSEITARSKDGLKITLSLSIHYKVGTQFSNTTKLLEEFIDIYARYGKPIESWRPMINKVTVASVSTTLQNFESFDLFRNRDEIINALESELTDNLRKLGFTVTRINVMNVEIPAKFNAAVKKTQIVK